MIIGIYLSYLMFILIESKMSTMVITKPSLFIKQSNEEIQCQFTLL